MYPSCNSTPLHEPHTLPSLIRPLFASITADFQAIFQRDPAARNKLEVLFCYPGFHALLVYRVAHALHRSQVPFLPRFLSYLARFATGVEIHPAAQLGRGIVIDHGMGVVIGETAIVGDYTLIYQGVTLGGTGKEQGKRHPTVGSHVVIGAGAKVLGNIEVGDRTRIGAGSVVLRSVPPDCTAVGIPARVIHRNPADQRPLPDTEAIVIRTLLDRIEKLEEAIATLQNPTKQTKIPITSTKIPITSSSKPLLIPFIPEI